MWLRKSWKGPTTLPKPQGCPRQMWGAWDGRRHLLGSGTQGNQNWRLIGHLQVKMGACLLLRVPQNREARERGEGRGVGKKTGKEKRR